MPQVSVGQAAATALARHLKAALSQDVTVLDRWPEFNGNIFAALTPGDEDQRAVVSVIKVGRRQRLSVVTVPKQADVTNLPDGRVLVAWPIGSVIQPVQIDVWAKTDDDRDDLVRQLDDALNVGTSAIPGAPTADPAADGVQAPLDPAALGYGGTVDYFLDEPEIDDSPESVQRSEYRATYFGEARAPLAKVVTASTLAAAMLTLGATTQPLSGNTPLPAAQTWGVQGPGLSSVSPSSGFMGGGQTVTIAGTGFTPGAQVTFGGAPAPSVQVLSPTQIAATVPESITPGLAPIVVTNPTGARTTQAVLYRYTLDSRMLGWSDPRRLILDVNRNVQAAPNRTGGNALVAAGNERPAYQPGGIAGTPAIVLAGAQRLIGAIPQSFGGAPGLVDATLMVVFGPTGPGIIGCTAVTAGDPASTLQASWTSAPAAKWVRRDAAATTDTATASSPPNGAAVWTFLFDHAAGMTIRRAGQVLATKSPPYSSGTATAQILWVLGGQSPAQDIAYGPAFGQGLLGHALLFNAALGSADLAYYEGLLAELSNL